MHMSEVHGIPDKMVELLKELYTETCSSVLSDGVWFEVLNAVCQWNGKIFGPNVYTI